VQLYRPLGLHELQLVADSGWREWPPRLPHQPIFYLVLEFSYARAIARDWNPTDEASGFVGFVSRFKVVDEFAARYPVQVAGGRSHRELWVPAAELRALNANLRGFIEIVEAFTGPRFRGSLDPATRIPAPLVLPRASAAPLRFSCPCCRCLTLTTRSGFECCPDDPDVDAVRGGPNGSLSLSQARANFSTFGASDQLFTRHVRPPFETEL